MKIRSENSIYQVISGISMSSAKAPMTCAELMEIPEMRAAAIEKFGSDIQVATNKLSDMLGFLWRRTTIARFDAPLTAATGRSMARYAYWYVDKAKVDEVDDGHPRAPISPPIPLHIKPSFNISERNGSVIIDFPNFTITVNPK